jgi:glyoxylase-like metal-dependent hydrolase (beta-lactamase superfamily II)
LWNDVLFEVIPLPGHTFGSVGYLFEVDGQRVLACGDLLSGAGQIRDYYPLQWRYMDFQGHVNWLESLKVVAELGLDLILPGHGRPFAPTAAALSELQRRGERLYELFYARPYTYFRPLFRRLSEHVHEVTNSMANSYIVDDGAGHALLIDCGYTASAPISANPHRFIDNLTAYLEPELGIRQVEWFLPSHYHDDHLAGYAALRNRYGTKIAASPELRDILEHPERFDMPCLVPEGYAVEHVIERGSRFVWRGIEFWMEQHPGQTLYHHLIWFNVDGLRYLCIGDNVSGLGFREQRDFIHSFIPKNRTPVSSYTDMPRQILTIAPDLLLTGHGGAVPYDQAQVERWQGWMDEWQRLFTEMIDQPHPNLGMDPRWVEFYPYKVRIKAGETHRFRLRVVNHEGA